MSIQAIVWALNTRVGDPTLKVLLVALCNYANTENQTWHRQETICYDTEISVRTLRRRMKELEDMGLIRVEERRNDDGTKTSNLVTILMEDVDHQRPPVAGGSIGQKPGSPAATKVAGHRNVKNRKEDSMYSEEFEALWQAYPRTKNTSKKAAWDIYRMLNAENQERVRTAVPQFAAAMRAEGRTEDKIKHMQFWLSARMYETASAPASVASAAPVKPFWERATRKDWANTLLAWSNNWVWSKSWGPEPGKDGCHVPQDILDRFDLKYRGHLFSPEHMAAIRERVSKQAVDTQLATVP